MEMEGILISCLYSYGCPELRQFGTEKFIFEFLRNPEKSKLPFTRTILEKLEPYLFYYLIGKMNDLAPFNQRVVKAHWLGNNLLRKIEKEDVQELLRERLQGHQTRFIKLFDLVGGKAHHNFSTLWLIKRIENLNLNLKIINDCLIRLGEILEIKEERFFVKTQKLALTEREIYLRDSIEEIPKFFLRRPVKFNDWISIHFGTAREKISRNEAKNLIEITKEAISFFQG